MYRGWTPRTRINAAFISRPILPSSSFRRQYRTNNCLVRHSRRRWILLSCPRRRQHQHPLSFCSQIHSRLESCSRACRRNNTSNQESLATPPGTAVSCTERDRNRCYSSGCQCYLRRYCETGFEVHKSSAGCFGEWNDQPDVCGWCWDFQPDTEWTAEYVLQDSIVEIVLLMWK